MYNGIEQLIEKTRKVRGHQEEPFEEKLEDETQPHSLESGMRGLADCLITTIEQGLKVYNYVGVYVCMYVCMYMLVCMYVCMFVCVCMYTIYNYMYVHHCPQPIGMVTFNMLRKL